MNKKEILKELFPEKNEAELNDLVSSIVYKNNNKTIEAITSEDVEEETANILDYNSISNLGQFLSMANRIGENKRFDKYYKRIFNRRKDAETIDYWEWDKIVEWLIRQLYAQPHKSMEYLVNLYRTVKINHDRNQELKFDPWIESRYKEFESWLVERLYYLFPPTKNQMLEKSKSSNINGFLFKDLFISESDYNKVIKLMIAKERFLESSGKLIFIPFRKGCKYEIEAFRQALSFKQVLNPIQQTPKELLSIYLNSFNIKTTDKTLRSPKIPDKVKKYLSILTDIS